MLLNFSQQRIKKVDELKPWIYLRFEVSVNDALTVHEVDDFGHLLDVLGRLDLGETFPTSEPIEKFAASKKFGDDVRVDIILKKK